MCFLFTFLWESTLCFFKQRRFYISVFLYSFDASFLYRALHHSLYQGIVFGCPTKLVDPKFEDE